MNNHRMMARLNRCMKDIAEREIRIMEICGTHTRAVSRSGIRHLLPQNVMLLSGPGCPVCVTSESYIDHAMEIMEAEGVMLVTFGDMAKVKGPVGNLMEKQTQGAELVVVYSPEDALSLALKNKNRSVVFAAAGFETTAPLIAAVAKLTFTNKISNLFFLTALKCMEPVIRLILQDKRNKIDAMICPGHVASIKGSEHFRFITDEFGVPAVVCGFEAVDIMAGICLLLEQFSGKRPVEFVNLYKRCVRPKGNEIAQCIINEVFDTADGIWRGIGPLSRSALVFNRTYHSLDAAERFGFEPEQWLTSSSCRCTDILLGHKLPFQCKHFGTTCTPAHPAGPCMVSSEGACAIHYRYGGNVRYG